MRITVETTHEYRHLLSRCQTGLADADRVSDLTLVGGLGVAVAIVVAIGGAWLVDRVTGGELLGGRGAVLLPVFAVLMALVALLAAVGPARRGLRIEPTEALRADG